MDWLLENASDVALIVALAGFFITWRSDERARADAQKQRDEALLLAIHEVAKLVREGNALHTQEHKGLARTIERLDSHTVEEHRGIAEALTGLTVSLNHLIDDMRARAK